MILPRIPDIHRFYIFQYPCSSVLFVGDSFCCLRFILPQIPQIFTDFIYPRIRVHLCYLWEILSPPISVLICAICGRFLRTLTYVGDSLCCLRFDSPTDFHRFYISYVLSVRDSFIRCICGNLTKSIAIDFSNDTIINVICIEINKDTDMLFGEAKISKQLLMMYWF